MQHWGWGLKIVITLEAIICLKAVAWIPKQYWETGICILSLLERNLLSRSLSTVGKFEICTKAVTEKSQENFSMPLPPAGAWSTICEVLSATVTFQCFIFSIGNKVSVLLSLLSVGVAVKRKNKIVYYWANQAQLDEGQIIFCLSEFDF